MTERPYAHPCRYGCGTMVMRRRKISSGNFACFPCRMERKRAYSREHSTRQRAHVKQLLSDIPCHNCPHSGDRHHWGVQRLRGKCREKGCDCGGFIPKNGKPVPANMLIARLRSR